MKKIGLLVAVLASVVLMSSCTNTNRDYTQGTCLNPYVEQPAPAPVPVHHDMKGERSYKGE